MINYKLSRRKIIFWHCKQVLEQKIGIRYIFINNYERLSKYFLDSLSFFKDMLYNKTKKILIYYGGYNERIYQFNS